MRRTRSRTRNTDATPASFGQEFVDPAASSRLLVGDLTPEGMSGNCPTTPMIDYGQNGPTALALLQGNDNSLYRPDDFPAAVPRATGVK